MALILNDRVKESTTSTGTGTINLDGATGGFKSFVAGIGTTNRTYYAIVGRTTTEFEVGLGTVTDASPDTLSRDVILSSSNSDAKVSFSAGTKDVFCTLPSSKEGLPFPSIHGSSSEPQIITVKVGSKTSNHPYPAGGSSSSNAYFLNGLESPALRFSGADSGGKYYYKFDISDSSNSGHPLRFYLEPDKTTAYTTGVTTSGSGGSSGDYIQIAVDANTPNILYYQCSSHGYMGNHAVTVGNDFNGDVNLRNNLDLADAKKIKLGNSDDLQIYHDGSNSFIDNSSGTGALVLKPSGSTLITNSSGQNIISQQTDAAHLHYNGSTKLQTTNTGLSTTGALLINSEYTLPTADGSANQIMETDGSGTLSFVNKPTAGASAGFVIAMSVAL
jgi:hypothetical protein